MKKRILLWLVCLSVLTLSGCALQTVEQMYSPPKRSAEYSSLQTAMDEAMTGLEYAAPLSGSNQQSVQQADLDGDGKDEYLVFAKGTTEKPLHVLIFREDEENSFSLSDTVQCNGTAFQQVEYADLNGQDGVELIVGCQLSGQVQRIATVLSFSGGQSAQLFSTVYARMLTCDLDADGSDELMVVRYGESDSDKDVAMLFYWKNGTMERSREAMLSQKADNIQRITLSTLQSGEPAVYVATSVDDSAIATDVFAIRDEAFTNISFSSESETSVQTLRNYYIYSEDIDGDGVLELPKLLTMKSASSNPNEEKQYLICWYALDIQGGETEKYYTFHNYTDGWYLSLDSEWISRVAMEQDGNTYTFYIWNEDYDEAMAIFSVYSLTGTDRDTQAGEQNRFALYRGESVVYAAKLESASALYGITKDYLMDCFHLIGQDA